MEVRHQVDDRDLLARRVGLGRLYLYLFEVRDLLQLEGMRRGGERYDVTMERGNSCAACGGGETTTLQESASDFARSLRFNAAVGSLTDEVHDATTTHMKRRRRERKGAGLDSALLTQPPVLLLLGDSLTHGWCSFAKPNISRITRALSPMYLSTIADATTDLLTWSLEQIKRQAQSFEACDATLRQALFARLVDAGDYREAALTLGGTNVENSARQYSAAS